MARKILNLSINPRKLETLNRYIVQEGFNSKLSEVGKLNLSFTHKPTQGDMDISDNLTIANGVLKVMDSISKYTLDPRQGLEFSRKVTFSGYDESKLQFDTLEGVANIISHSMVAVANQEFYPISFITLYFYTRSSEIVEGSKYIKYSLNPDVDSNRDYAEDRNKLIQDNILDNSIIFIDGPLIGGNLSSYSLDLIEHLHEKNVIPVFFVKNSDSNLVIDSIDQIRYKYNSDLHWSYKYLKQGERTNLFQYTDLVNPNNTKMFCYIKPFNYTSPQRVEFHPKTFALYKDYIEDLFNMIFYLMLVQGDKSNPQIRPIAIAEIYAREIIKTVNTRGLLRNTSLIPTINQDRFGA